MKHLFCIFLSFLITSMTCQNPIGIIKSVVTIRETSTVIHSLKEIQSLQNTISLLTNQISAYPLVKNKIPVLIHNPLPNWDYKIDIPVKVPKVTIPPKYLKINEMPLTLEQLEFIHDFDTINKQTVMDLFDNNSTQFPSPFYNNFNSYIFYPKPYSPFSNKNNYNFNQHINYNLIIRKDENGFFTTGQ